MSVTFHCGCGFKYEGDDPCAPEIADHDPGDSCCNCSGQRCMDCVFRAMHDECMDDCPTCCPMRGEE